MTLWKWSRTAASNATADSTINWAEGQAPSSVNNSSRAEMAAVAKYRDDVSGVVNSAGSSNAYTFTSYQVLTSLTDGYKVTFRANHTNTAGAATLAVDGLAAKPLRAHTGANLPAGVIVSGSIYSATYDSGDDEWMLHAPMPLAVMLGANPIGAVVDFAGTTAPNGWLLCYGQAVSRTTYALLFAVTSTTYGVGDGSTTFNLPDIRGRVVAGQDDMGGTSANRLTDQTDGLNGDTLGATGGAETHTLTEAQLPAHSHTFTYNADDTGNSGNNRVQNIQTSGGGTSVTTSSTGSSAAHNNVQPTIILNKIIFTGISTA